MAQYALQFIVFTIITMSVWFSFQIHMESGSENIHNGLSFIFKQQMYFRNRESAGRVFAESLNKGVMYWSLAASCLILILGVGQVMVLRSFFSDKKSTVPVHS